MKKKIVGMVMSLTLAMGICTTSLAADTNSCWGYSQQDVQQAVQKWSQNSNWWSQNNWWNQDSSPSEDEEQSKPDYKAPTAVLIQNDIGTSSRYFKVSWEKDPDTTEKVTKYVIRRAENQEFEDAEISEVSCKNNSAGFRISSGGGVYYYPCHYTYYVQVKAVYENGESDWSNTVVAPGDLETTRPQPIG